MKVEVDGVGIACEVAGAEDGVPLVFSHSLGADRSMWLPQVDRLGSDHHILLVDTLGHGASDAPDGPYTLDRLASLVLMAIDAVGLDRFHFCGISMGGQIGLWLAINHPDRLLSLIAANTAGRVGRPEAWADRVERVDSEGMQALAPDVIGRWLLPGFAEREPELWRHLHRVFQRTDPGGYIGCCQALAEADLTADLGSIRVPTLVVGGDADVSTPPEQTSALAAAIPGSRLVQLPAAHLSNLDRPLAFAEAVRKTTTATW